MSDVHFPEEDKLLYLFNRWRKVLFDERPLNEGGTSPSQMALVEYIAKSPGSGIQEIANGLDLTAPTVSVAIRRLEKERLVERKPDIKDGRSVQLFLSEKGQKLFERMRDFQRKKLRLLLSGLSTEERVRFLDLFEQAVRTAESGRE